MRILVVEDNWRLAETLKQGLREEGHEVEYTGYGVIAAQVGLRLDLDAIVLDLGLPDLDGIEVLKQIRDGGSNVPILVLTARDAVWSRVDALQIGADDYLVKPFSFEELIARLQALGRRARAPRWAPLSAGRLAVYPDLTCLIEGRRVKLSPRQHALLAYLMRRRGEVVSRADIFREVFGYVADPGTNVIDVHLAHLRRKIGAGVLRIETVRGAGIRLETEP